MTYKQKTIRDVIKLISKNDLVLPSIQREFVWRQDKIVLLFDSIMQGFPIGTFIFWKLSKKIIKNYTFYKFILEWKDSERERVQNEKVVPIALGGASFGVVDGQQRFGSLYIGLCGTYRCRRKHARKDKEESYPRRKLHLNLLKDSDESLMILCPRCEQQVPLSDTCVERGTIPSCPNCGKEIIRDETDDTRYEFKFRTEEEAKQVDPEHFWFPIRQILLRKSVRDCTNYVKQQMEDNDTLREILKDNRKKQTFSDNLRLLWKRIMQDFVVSFFELNKFEEIEEVLPIFVRVNAGGVSLSKNGILFSTIVAHWEEGRDEIEELLGKLNGKGKGFSFDVDFVMRASLVLTDCPVLYKVQTFRGKNVLKIKENWDRIRDSLEKAIDLAVRWGYHSENLRSKLAILPVAYHIYQGRDYRGAKNLSRIKYYLISAHLKKIFGGNSDRLLAKIREQQQSRSKDFNLHEIEQVLKSYGKTILHTEEDIETYLDKEKGPYTYMVLTYLYRQYKYEQLDFQQDHCHPLSGFSYRIATNQGISSENQKEWCQLKNRLANLQLLESKENMDVKKAIPLQEWVEKQPDPKNYRHQHYIPPDVNLEFRNFDKFYTQRRLRLKGILKKELKWPG